MQYGRNKTTINKETLLMHLENKIATEILELRNQENESYWDKVEDKNLRYFVRNCIGHPWVNHFALALLCLSDRQLTPTSIMSVTTVLNARFRDLFTHFNLKSMEEFFPIHIEQYVNGQVLSEHSDRQRQSLLSFYGTFAFNLKKWIGTKFSSEQQTRLLKYTFQSLPFDNRDFSVREKSISSAKTKRKEDTSAVTPILPEIRAEGHLRWNQVSRLRNAFRNAIKTALSEKAELPIEFNYDEIEYAGERWYFKLHHLKKLLGRATIIYDNDDFVLEFVKAEKIEDGTIGDGPWFLDLLRLKLLGNWATKYTTDEHMKKCIEYLNHWGYDIEEGGEIPAPFLPRNTGLLIQGFDVTRAARLTNKLLINIEPIYIACMFAKFSLDIITSSGARMNELLQISYDKECCVVTVDNTVEPPRNNYILVDSK